MSTFTMGPSLLFCPADRPERFGKAAERADAVILDLEDAVAPDAKAQARQNVQQSALDPARTIVRVNAADSGELAADLEAVAASPYRTVMLAKTTGARQLSELEGLDVLALVETAAGVMAAAEIAAAPNVVGLMWGAEDLVASLGGTSSRRDDGRYRDVAVYARSQVLLAARAAGKAAIDAVYIDIPDTAGLAEEARDAVASGFTATACIHPSQVEVIRAAYRPSAEELRWAQAVLEAAVGQPGAFKFEDQMIDGPILHHARSIVNRAGGESPHTG